MFQLFRQFLWIIDSWSRYSVVLHHEDTLNKTLVYILPRIIKKLYANVFANIFVINIDNTQWYGVVHYFKFDFLNFI